ncbi:MAG: RusA family crossover junction endodeoxyribonuclease [Patescibacteria group bacterium]|nr:RusA family crossover junction endodeoxyribonuclease [Patescibacteria group bacterium]
MTSWTIYIPGELRGKQRPRVTRKGHTYTPQETLNAEAWVKACAIDAGVIKPLDGPLVLSLSVVRLVPASWSKKKRAAALNGDVRATGKPDLDNIVKLVGDALNGICWQDDSQIVSLHVDRVFGERAQSQVVVRQL